MTANPPKLFQLDLEDVEYFGHGDKSLLARLLKPCGAGSFPLVGEAHSSETGVIALLRPR